MFYFGAQVQCRIHLRSSILTRWAILVNSMRKVLLISFKHFKYWKYLRTTSAIDTAELVLACLINLRSSQITPFILYWDLWACKIRLTILCFFNLACYFDLSSKLTSVYLSLSLAMSPTRSIGKDDRHKVFRVLSFCKHSKCHATEF